MDNMQRRLEEARTELLRRQTNLTAVRALCDKPTQRLAEAAVCRAIDRAWEAQCMAQGSL